MSLAAAARRGRGEACGRGEGGIVSTLEMRRFAVGDVEEEEEETETAPSVGTSLHQCACARPLAAIKKAFQEWASYNEDRKQMLEPLREA